MNNLFDTHCHPHLNKEKNEKDVIENFFKNEGKYMIVIGTNPETNSKVIETSNQYNNIFSSIGIHPCDIYDLDLEKAITTIENHILKDKNKKIIAIGECGLDYYWLERDEKINNYEKEYREKIISSKKKLQEIFFKAQINLAKEYNLPIIIHNRDSKDDVLRILKETNFKNFIFHCYSEDLEYAEKLIDFSPECKISFSGIVTFKNAKEIQETAKNIDIKHILAETDSPYLTPTPFRGKEENEPLYTKYVIEKISDIRGEKLEIIEKEILNNSLKIFNIKS